MSSIPCVKFLRITVSYRYTNVCKLSSGSVQFEQLTLIRVTASMKKKHNIYNKCQVKQRMLFYFLHLCLTYVRRCYQSSVNIDVASCWELITSIGYFKSCAYTSHLSSYYCNNEVCHFIKTKYFPRKIKVFNKNIFSLLTLP